MRSTVIVMLALALLVAPVLLACPYHQAAGLLNGLYGDLGGDFVRVGPDQMGLDHMTMDISVDGGNAWERFRGHPNYQAVVNDVIDYVEDQIDIEGPTYKG